MGNFQRALWGLKSKAQEQDARARVPVCESSVLDGYAVPCRCDAVFQITLTDLLRLACEYASFVNPRGTIAHVHKVAESTAHV